MPSFFKGESEQIVRFLSQGIASFIHIRKPKTSASQVEELLLSIPTEYYSRLVLHDHFELALKYHLYGVHLNSRNPEPPQGWKGSVSRSCHSLEEVRQWKPRCNYITLSPIYDSISKPDYPSAFTPSQLHQAQQCGDIDHKVLALGGVTFSRIPEVLSYGFGGAMILGDAWK